MTEHHWVYSMHRPSPSRFRMDDLPGHRMGYKKRRDTITPRLVQFQPLCSCGSRCDSWFPNKASMERGWWDAHVAAFDSHLRLPL